MHYKFDNFYLSFMWKSLISYHRLENKSTQLGQWINQSMFLMVNLVTSHDVFGICDGCNLSTNKICHLSTPKWYWPVRVCSVEHIVF